MPINLPRKLSRSLQNNMDFTEPQLAAMYLLQEANIPLSLEQMGVVFSSISEYTYMHTALAIANLTDSGFVIKDTLETGEFYSLTVAGRINLANLKDMIRASLRSAISVYCKENLNSMRVDSDFLTNITSLSDGRYQVILRSFENNKLFNQTVFFAEDYELAQHMAKNWKLHGNEAINSMFSVLIQDTK